MKDKPDKLADTTASGSKTVIVSACLLGLPTRYDGSDCRNAELIAELTGELTKDLGGLVTIALCPEQLGGLPTPRACAEIIGGDGLDVLRGAARVIAEDNADVTDNFLKGAREVLAVARLNNVTRAYLKEKSPSCGVRLIKQKGRDTGGAGVLAALLKKNDIETISVA